MFGWFNGCKHVYAHWHTSYNRPGKLMRQCTKYGCKHIEEIGYDSVRDNAFEPKRGTILKTRQENLDYLGLKEYPR